MADRLAAAFSRLGGTVVTFDERVGAGIIRGEGGLEWPFHCTRIADGSRTVAIEAEVEFSVEPGPGGFEAVDVAPFAGSTGR